jgi:hypothetical protein
VRVRRDLGAIDVAIKLATVGLLAWAILGPDLPQFQGKAFSPEAATAYADTLLDLALGMVGGLAAAIVTVRLPLSGRSVPDSATVR